MENNPDLPKINIALIGQNGNGKTELAHAIIKVFSEKGITKYIDLDTIKKKYSDNHGSLRNFCFSLQTEKNLLNFVDTPGHVDRTNETIRGLSLCDCAVLVVSATDGHTPRMTEILRLAKQMNLHREIIIFLNKADIQDNNELIELISETLSKLNLKHAAIIKGSAKKAGEGDEEYQQNIIDLLSKIEENFSAPERNVENPFIVLTTRVWSRKDNNIIVSAKVDRGIIRVGDEFDIAFGKSKIGKIARIMIGNTQIEEAKCGDIVGLALEGLEDKDIKHGYYLYAPGSIQLNKSFEAKVYNLKNEENGRHTPYHSNYQFNLIVRGCRIEANATKLKNFDNPDDQTIENAMPGERIDLEFTTHIPVPLEINQRIIMREGGKTVAMGLIVKII